MRRENAVQRNVIVLPISTISIFGSDICTKISGCGSGGGLLVVLTIESLSKIKVLNVIIQWHE